MAPACKVPPFCGLLNISALQAQYGIQVFAKFKRPECTTLHLRELQTQNIQGGACTRNSLETTPLAVLMGAIAPILPLYTISVGPHLYEIILPRLYSMNWKRYKE